MANIGSVFLGDTKRHRLLSSSTPPSSPPPTVIANMSGVLSSLPSPRLPPSPSIPSVHTETTPQHTPSIDPQASLELRLRWLEAIVLGVKQHNKALQTDEPLTRAADNVQGSLNGIVETNDSIKKFVNQYDQYAQYLTPAFASSGFLPDPPIAYENMSTEEFEVFLAEMENDIRAADRDMREIEALDKRGVTGAGKLTDYENLQLRLSALLSSHNKNLERAKALETRIGRIMENHVNQADALSELFVAWDDAITGAESRTSRAERQHVERVRMGLDSE